MKNFFITYWWVAVSIDWASTIVAHDYRVEENPFMKSVWQNHGDIGFTLASIAFGIGITLAIHYGFKYAYKAAVVIALVPMITFKLLIALTNLAVIPYSVMAWFHF